MVATVDDDDLFRQANNAFGGGDYEDAVSLYTSLLNQQPNVSEVFLKRANAYFLLEQYADAAADAQSAINLDAMQVKAYLRRGASLFHLDDFQTAFAVFQKGESVAGKANVSGNINVELARWIRKCIVELEAQGIVVPTEEPEKGPMPVDSVDSGDLEISKSLTSAMRIKHDWYQTESDVTVSVMIKKAGRKSTDVVCSGRDLSITMALASGSDYSLELELAHPVRADDIKVLELSTKVEVKMPKVEALRWGALERAPGHDDVVPQKWDDATSSSDNKETVDKAPTYPSSQRQKKNWDKIEQDAVKEEEDMKLEGDAALQKLFKQIYRDGNEETRRAMNKSFQQSGGTVLSTDWKDIGTRQVDMKPPDGMESKNYEF